MLILSFYLLLASPIHADAAGPACTNLFQAACAPGEDKEDGFLEVKRDDFAALFQAVVTSAQAVVERKIPNTNQALAMKALLGRVKLDINDCGNPTEDNSNYFRGTLTYCSGSFLKRKSLFAQAAVLAHELGHAFDPCESAFEQNAWKGVESCLRDPRSVGAQVWGFSDLSNFEKRCEKSSQLCDLGITPACQNFTLEGCASKAPRCNSDQITEAFADWFSAEVLAHFLASRADLSRLNPDDFARGMKSIAKLSCGANYGEKSLYPAPQDRIERILAANPALRARIGCNEPSSVLYCK